MRRFQLCRLSKAIFLKNFYSFRPLYLPSISKRIITFCMRGKLNQSKVALAAGQARIDFFAISDDILLHKGFLSLLSSCIS